MSQYKKNCIATEGLGSWAGRWARQQARAGGARRSRRAYRARGRRAWARGQAQAAGLGAWAGLGQAQAARACGRWARAGARGRLQRHAGRPTRTRQARGLGAGRAAWARGLALGCALGALGLFSIRFDSFFFF